MTPNPTDEVLYEIELDPEHDDDIDDEFDDDDYDDEFLGDDTWEDQAGLAALKDYLKLSPDWFLVKVVNFDWRKLDEIDAWLKDNCRAPYKRVGWSSGCSTKVGVAFENSTDAIFFKLTWR